MDTEKIKGCMVSLSDASNALEDLKQIISSHMDPAILLSPVFAAVSHPIKIQEAVRAIGRIKPELVFIVLRPPG